MIEKPHPDQKDDINYFKKKLICQIIDGDYERATVSLRRLKLIEDADVTYKLARKEKELDLPKCYNICIKRDGIYKWLHRDKWISSKSFCNEYKTKEDVEYRMNIGLPDIPYGYSRPFVEESYCMSEESKKELLMDNGVDVEKKLQDELAKQIIEDQETFKLMEELLPKLIALLPTKGINLKEKIDNIKKRLGVSYVDVLWKALVCLDENCTFPIDGIDYDKRNGETR